MQEAKQASKGYDNMLTVIIILLSLYIRNVKGNLGTRPPLPHTTTGGGVVALLNKYL